MKYEKKQRVLKIAITVVIVLSLTGISTSVYQLHHGYYSDEPIWVRSFFTAIDSKDHLHIFWYSMTSMCGRSNIGGLWRMELDNTGNVVEKEKAEHYISIEMAVFDKNDTLYILNREYEKYEKEPHQSYYPVLHISSLDGTMNVISTRTIPLYEKNAHTGEIWTYNYTNLPVPAMLKYIDCGFEYYDYSFRGHHYSASSPLSPAIDHHNNTHAVMMRHDTMYYSKLDENGNYTIKDRNLHYVPFYISPYIPFYIFFAGAVIAVVLGVVKRVQMWKHKRIQKKQKAS